MTVYHLRNESGIEVFTGTITPAPGGGSPVQAGYEGNAVTIADGASADVTWDTLDYGTDLLDRTTPDSPTILAAGLYAITATVAMSAITPGGTAQGSVQIGEIGGSTAAFVPAAFGRLLMLVTVVSLYAAGDPCGITVLNADGVASRDFNLQQATVVKLA